VLKDLTALRHGALTAIVVAILAAGSNAMAACQSSDGEIEVRVDAVRSSAGSIVAVLYGDNPADFLKKGKRLDSVCLTAPAPGVYAVAVYHDENGNEKFDKTWIGLPDEGYGISNNPKIFISAPAFDEAKFEAFNGSTVIDIVVGY